MRPNPSWQDLHEALMSCIDVAQCRATATTLEAIAEAAGIKQLRGKPVREFFGDEAMRETELAIADVADDDPLLASLVKARWDEMGAIDAAAKAQHREAYEEALHLPDVTATTVIREGSMTAVSSVSVAINARDGHQPAAQAPKAEQKPAPKTKRTASGRNGSRPKSRA